MSKIEIISRKENLIEKVADLLVSSKNTRNNLVVFPNRRPVYFLSLYLYERKGKPFESPDMFSIDDFIDMAFEFINPHSQIRNVDEIELIALLYEYFKSYCRDITGPGYGDFSLDFFMPWARKIIADCEELKINRINPQDMRDFDFLIKEKDEGYLRRISELDGFKNKYMRFSQLYENFYEKCASENIYTRAMKYDFVASHMSDLDLSKYEKVIFAGFFALTKSEKDIFLNLHSLDNVFFVYTASKLLAGRIPFRVDVCSKIEDEDTVVRIRKTGSIHEQVMELKRDLMANSDVLNSSHDIAIILPDSNMILPVIENVLGDIEKFNISAGYPLKMTPIYSMIQALFDLLSSFKESSMSYQIKKYISFMFHPYVKNLNTAGSSEATRILLQELFDKLSKSHFISRIKLDDIEKISGNPSLREMHDKLIRPFEKISNIGELADRLADVVDLISKKSTANKHPYWNYFPAIISERLRHISLSKLADMDFQNRLAYFSFINAYLSGISHPFKGSPVEGLQCLGFLEARNLKFKNLFVLDVNDGILPSLKKEDTIIPFIVRERLGLSTYKSVYDIYSYYFENMVFSSKKAMLYYVDDKNREASPILEKLKWDLEKKGITAEIESSTIRVDFSRNDPQNIAKTPQIKRMLESMVFSYSSIDRYLNCQLAFYYEYVLRLKKQQDISIEPGADRIGVLFHEILKIYFSSLPGGRFIPEERGRYKADIVKVASELIEKNFFSGDGLEGYMLKSQILKRVRDVIDFHLERHASSEIISCEKELSGEFDIDGVPVKIRAIIDRIDRRDNVICLLDYKTSSIDEYALPSEKFSADDLKLPVYQWGPKIGSIQLPLYVLIYCQAEKREENVIASIITLGSKEINESIIFDSPQSREKIDLFRSAIQLALRDILKSDFFLKPVDEEPCTRCHYKTICGRQWVEKDPSYA